MKNLLDRRIVPIWIVQFGANLGLLAIAYWWLLWPDAQAWQVVASLIVSVAILFLAAWLHAGTLSYFVDAGGLRSAFQRGFRRVPVFLIWAIAFALALWALGRLRDAVPQASVRMAQILGSGPRPLRSAADWVVAALQYVAAPAFFFVFLAEVIALGFRGWRLRALANWKRARYWVVLGVALLVGALAPYKLIWWVPLKGSSLTAEAWSAILRFGLAYLLAVTTWVAFARELAADVVPANPASAQDVSHGSELA